jgi:cathepsin L
MRVFLVIFFGLCSILLVNSYEPVDPSDWEDFKAQYGKSYESASEEAKRMDIWMRNKANVEQHNKKFNQGEVSYRKAINKFSDMTTLEVQKRYVGTKPRQPIGAFEKQIEITPLEPLPKEMDWRKRGAVTEVKDQGDCESGYAFSAVGSVEGQYFQKTGELVNFSVEQVIDCSAPFGNSRCSGGNMPAAYFYISSETGITSEDVYPFVTNRNETKQCSFNPDTAVAEIFGFFQYTESEFNLKHAVGFYGPISVAVNVGNSFISYSGGIYNEPNCLNGYLHGVLVVGYGRENQTDYWIVKNSWGTKWGEQGYIRMSRNNGNQCSIASHASAAMGVDKIKNVRSKPVTAPKEPKKSYRLRNFLSKFSKN